MPLTLQELGRLRNPAERVPLGERLAYERGLELIEDACFEGFRRIAKNPQPLQIQLAWRDPEWTKNAMVQVLEDGPLGTLGFTCSLCSAQSGCAHRWATTTLMWQALTTEQEDELTGEFARLARELRGHLQGVEAELPALTGEWAEVQFESISLVLDEAAPIFGDADRAWLRVDFSKYRPSELAKDRELPSPRLWNLPEIFRRKLTAYSGHYLHEVNRQNRLAETVRYNFSNGHQISAREILRHPLQKRVPGDFLPQGKTSPPIFARWPLVDASGDAFVSQAVHELEEIMQALIYRLSQAQEKRKVDLYLQNSSGSRAALQIRSIEYDPVREMYWRVGFAEKKELIAEFKLMNFRKRPLVFFESYALEPEEGVLIVHPWRREFDQLQEVLGRISPELTYRGGENPGFEIVGESGTKAVLRSLRQRSIPIEITGESRTLGAHQSRTEIRLDGGGIFYLQHQARVTNQKDLVRRGFTATSTLFLQALSKGLPFFLNTEAKDLAARTGTRREWDLKLLKHLGILQYLFLEILNVQFLGHLTDGMVVQGSEVFSTLQGRIRALLVVGSTVEAGREGNLSDLCSRAVLAGFEEFIRAAFAAFSSHETFYSEQGEVILEGVTDREFRLIHELLLAAAVESGGETFKKARTPFLSRISKDYEKDPSLVTSHFHFPTVGAGDENALRPVFESLQTLIAHGFQIFFKDQPLQELGEDEFKIDFVLRAEGDTDARFFNWFELNPKFFLRGEEVDADQLLGLGSGGVIEYAGKLYMVPRKQLPSLRRLENFWQKLQKGKIESGKRKKGDKIYQLPRSQTLELLALRASGISLRGDHEWQRLCDFYDSLGTSTRELKLPTSIRGELKPYQQIGVQWLQDLYQLRLGALLADDMGLGKTLQTLSFMEDLRSRDELGHCLVVVPSSLIFNWQAEVEKFTPELPLVVFSNRDREKIARRLLSREPVVVIATYGLLMEHGPELSQYKWQILVFDEAQNLKNISTKRTSAARALTAQFKICLTGTPMENHFGEFYSLVDLLVPGGLGRIEDFRRRFVHTEMVTREEIDDLKLKIRPLLLRRTKKEILDQLPEKQETKVSIAFEERQKEIYRDIALSYNQRVQETMEAQGEASVQLQMLTALLRLRQACSDPGALPNIRYEKVPPKLETLLDSLREIVESGESALVFTQFLQTLEHAAGLLKKAGLPVFVMHGAIPARQRQTLLSDFHKTRGGAVLLMTLKTGGVGLNLTKASYVFHLEPWWNPSVENQATDRAHRLGQSKAVQVFRYIMHESLEEKIELLKMRKDRKFQALFSESETGLEPGAGSSRLSKEDFDLLIGVKGQ